MIHPYLLIVHPDKSSRMLLKGMLDGLDYRIAEAPGYRVGAGMLGRDPDALVLAGASAGDPEASDFLAFVQRQQPQVPLILFLSGEAPDLANRALRNGAASVLRFPLPTTQVRAAVIHALNRPVNHDVQSARERNQPAPPPPPHRPVEAALVGEDAGLRQALDLARAIAPIHNPALIVGERGCGKSLLARVIHELSPRRNGPFVEITCRAREDAALEEELFGGWCDGAEVKRPGKVAEAHGGTLVLDEINTLSPPLQLKLHVTLQDGKVECARSSRPRPVDIRLIMTSYRDGAAEALPGRFWQFVYTQRSTTTLRLPPLQDRGSDVIRLAEHFRVRAAREFGRDVVGFHPEALEVLGRYSWPGNVGELRTVVRKAVSHCQGPTIKPIHLSLDAGKDVAAVAKPARARALQSDSRIRIQPLRESLAEPEKWLILRALQARDWNRQEAADALVINRATLEKKMKKYGLFSGNGQVLHPCGEEVES